MEVETLKPQACNLKFKATTKAKSLKTCAKTQKSQVVLSLCTSTLFVSCWGDDVLRAAEHAEHSVDRKSTNASLHECSHYPIRNFKYCMEEGQPEHSNAILKIKVEWKKNRSHKYLTRTSVFMYAKSQKSQGSRCRCSFFKL